MEKPIRAAIVGCGSIAGVHAQILSQMDGVSLCGFVDVRPERALALSKQYGNLRQKGPQQDNPQQIDPQSCVYSSVAELLHDQDLDVVHICTPHHLHVPMACEILAAGKSVFMEKPPAISQEQFQTLCQADRESPGRLGFCFQNRYNASTLQVDQILQEKRLGAVLGGRAFVTWNRTREYYETSGWRGRLATEGGGALINQSIHTLDLLLRWLGTPERVHASMSNFRLDGITEVEDTVAAYLEFPDGVQGCFYAANTYITDMPVIIEIGCESGFVRLEGRHVTCRWHDGAEEHIQLSGAKPLGKSYWGDGHDACIHDFYTSLKDGTPFAQDLASVETTFQVMAQIYEASGWRKF